MATNLVGLSAEQIEQLRERHEYYPDLSWVPGAIRDEGWQAVNGRFLETERQRSADAMRDLMDAVGIARASSPGEALELIALASEVFAPTGGFKGRVVRESENSLRIENAHCPVYEGLEDAGWHTVTACPSWYRRQGWIDALEIPATNTTIQEQLWGDAACASIVAVRPVVSQRAD